MRRYLYVLFALTAAGCGESSPIAETAKLTALPATQDGSPLTSGLDCEESFLVAGVTRTFALRVGRYANGGVLAMCFISGPIADFGFFESLSDPEAYSCVVESDQSWTLSGNVGGASSTITGANGASLSLTKCTKGP